MATHSAVRLCRVSGLHRLVGGAWVDDAGDPVDDDAALRRLRALAIPPAWREVWASTDADARVQATGVDARGRTQYRYSVQAEAEAARLKFHDLLAFGSALPELRSRVASDLGASATDAPGDRVRQATAAVVRLIDRGLFRVGSNRYARDNHTYGLTTLTTEHVVVEGPVLEFTFVGKEHRPWHVSIDDGTVAGVVSRLIAERTDAAAPLFAVDTANGRHDVTSVVVNAYIHAATAAPASAKTFRTWGGTAAAATTVAGATAGRGESSARARRIDLAAFDAAAALLGNTRDVARRSYVHPMALRAGASEAVTTAVRRAIAETGSDDVRSLLASDDVVRALSAELERLASEPVGVLG